MRDRRTGQNHPHEDGQTITPDDHPARTAEPCQTPPGQPHPPARSRWNNLNRKLAPNLLQGLAACACCGYGYYRTSTRTTKKKIFYYRCLGSDDYRYVGGRVCANKPVRADLLDEVVWGHITALLADPTLIRAEIDKRLTAARSADPVRRQRSRLEAAAAKASAAIARMIEAFSEQLITIDELRSRMPDLRAREASLKAQIQAVDAQIADRDAYLTLADDLEGFLTQLRENAATASIEDKRRVLRLLIKDVLIGPEKITIRHRIPIREHRDSGAPPADGTDTEGGRPRSCQLRWRSGLTRARQSVPALRIRPLDRPAVPGGPVRALRGLIPNSG